MLKQEIKVRCAPMLPAIVAGSFFIFGALAQSPAPPAKIAPVRGPAQYMSKRLPDRVALYYTGIWGVDSLTVKLAESGELIRFSYHVVDAAKAATLNDKKAEPSLIDAQAGVRLVIPVVQNVGALRQTQTPEAGKSYWMAFSNSGRPVKKGDFVDVVIGNFRATGLVVE